LNSIFLKHEILGLVVGQMEITRLTGTGPRVVFFIITHQVLCWLT